MELPTSGCCVKVKSSVKALTCDESGLDDALHSSHGAGRRHVAGVGYHGGIEQPEGRPMQQVNGYEEPWISHHRVQEHTHRHGRQGDAESHHAAQFLEYHRCNNIVPMLSW